MMQRNRTSRISPLRRTLNVEALEDRTLLTGAVTAILAPSGTLQITGDAADNHFTIAPSPVAGHVRVSGTPGTFTAINGVGSVDILSRDLTDITMTLLQGKDRATLLGFSISGDVNIFYGNPESVFTFPGFTAAHINQVLTNTGPVIPPPGPGPSPVPGIPPLLGSGSSLGLLPPVTFGSSSTGGQLPPIGGSGSGNHGGQLPPDHGGGSEDPGEQLPPDDGGGSGNNGGQLPPPPPGGSSSGGGGVVGSGNNLGLLMPLGGIGGSGFFLLP
jgi:hypothetical protein